MQNDHKELFAGLQLRNTKSRNLVYDVLNESDAPMTAEQVYLKLRALDSPISLSTVYRILEVFVGKEIVLKTNLTDENKFMVEINPQGTPASHRLHRL
jgi:Fur family ferric uptake transcriptional regulator